MLHIGHKKFIKSKVSKSFPKLFYAYKGTEKTLRLHQQQSDRQH